MELLRNILHFIPSFKNKNHIFTRSNFWQEPKNIAIISFSFFIVLIASIFFRNQIVTFFSSDPGADPVAYWKFDEGQGSTANDSTGSNAGTLGTGTSAPTWISEDQCISGTCLQFDGTNDYSSFADSDSLDFGSTDSFTISGWFKTKPLTDTKVLLSKQETSFLAAGSTATTTIDTSTDSGVAGNDGSWSSRIVYDPLNDRWHVLYIDSGLDIHSRSTAATSGTSWDDGIDVVSGSFDYEDFSCEAYSTGSNTYMACAYNNSSDHNLYYKRCELTGSAPYITCDSEQTVYTSADTLDDLQFPHLALDSNNCGLIVVNYEDDSKLDADEHEVWFFKEASSCGDGIWTTESGFPKIVQAEDGFNTDIPVGIRSYGNLNAQVYWINLDNFNDANLDTVVFYGATNTFGTQQTFYTDVERNSNITQFESVVFNDNSVSFALPDGTTDLNAYEISTLNGTVSNTADTLLNVPASGSAIESIVTAAVDYHSTYGDDIYVFGVDSTDDSDIYYNISTNGGVTWNGSSTQWINSFDTNNVNNLSSRFNEENCDIMVGWVGNDSSPYNINTKIINTGSCINGVPVGYRIQINSDGGVEMFVSDGSRTDYVASTTEAYDDNTWHYVTAIKNGQTSMTLFIDGKQVAINNSLTAVGTLINDSGLYIGLDPNMFVNSYNGSLDEFKIYDYARTESQIKADYSSRGSTKGIAAQFGEDDMSRKLSNGLIGYWKMDEVGVSGSNWTAVDSSGNSNIATGLGNATVGSTVAGKFGNGGYFDGNGDYLSVPYTASLAPTDAISFGGWFRVVDKTQNIRIVSKTQAGGYNLAFNDTIASSLTGVINVGGSYYNLSYSNTNISNGTWYHSMVTYDGETAKLYLNGIVVNENTDPSGAIQYSVNNDFCIGGEPSNTSCNAGNVFIGSIDEVRVYNRALDKSEVQALYNFAPGPIGHWKMDDTNMSSTVDSSGNGNNGTTTGSPTFVTGKYGKALATTGLSQYTSVPDNDNLDFINAITFSFWMNPADATSVHRIFRKGNPYSIGGQGYSVLYRGDQANDPITVQMNDTSSSATVSVFNMGDVSNTWTHVTIVCDKSILECTGYKNGVFVGSGNMIAGNFNVADNFEISSPSIGYNGKIDDVKIYNYARTPGQIISDMNAGHPAPGSPVGSEVAHFHMDEGYGTIVNNSGNVGSTINGTITAATWTNEGKYGKALQFDGTDDYVLLSNSPALSPGSGDFTMSAWVNIGNTAAAGQMIYSDEGFGDSSIFIQKNTSGFRVFYQDNDENNIDVTGTTVPQEDRWYHVMGIKQGQTAYLYVNGTLEGTDSNLSLGTITTSDQEVPAIGTYSAFNDVLEFNGIIDEVKIYNFALATDQAKVEYNQGKSIVLGGSSSGVDGISPSDSANREYCVPGDSSTCNSPIAEWNLNENSGNTFYDTSGNNNSGTLGTGNSAPKWTVGYKGNGAGLQFDGINDNAVIPNNSILNIGTSDFTLSAWIKGRDMTTGDAIFTKTDGGGCSSTYGFHFAVFDNYPTLHFCTGGGSHAQVQGQSAMSNGQWYHINVVVDRDSSTNTKVYINGIPVTTSVSNLGSHTGSITNSIQLAIASESDGEYHWDGNLDQLKIYNYVRTPAQVGWEYNRGGATVYYKIDECTGSTINDASENNLNGTLELGASGVTTAGTCSTSGAWADGASGKFESSMSFDGSSDYISVSDNSFLDLVEDDDMSLSFWIKPSTLSTAKAIISKKTSNAAAANGFMIHTFNGGTMGFYLADSTTTNQVLTTTTSSLTVGQWTHVTITYDAKTNPLIYFNGKRQTTSSSGGGTIGTMGDLSNGSPLVLGAESDFQLLYYGQLDEVKFFRYALTQSQINTDMNGGAVRFQ